MSPLLKFMRMAAADVCARTRWLLMGPTLIAKFTFEVSCQMTAIVQMLFLLRWVESNRDHQSLLRCKIRYKSITQGSS